MEESQSTLNETNEALGKSYDEIGGKFSEFMSKIDGAGSILYGFNENILISSEKKQEIADNIDSVQKEITEICALATDERRQLTDSEIQRLNELFQKMHELSDQELAIEQAKQGVVATAAEDLANSADIGFEEYEQRSRKIANTAEETRSAVISKAEEQYYEELALLEQEYNTKSDYSQAQYERDRQAAKDDYDAAIAEANQKAGDTLKILADGYKDRAVLLKNSSGRLAGLNLEAEKEEKRHADVIDKIKTDAKTKAKQISGEQADESIIRHNEEVELKKSERKFREEELTHTINIGNIKNKQQKILNDENYQNQLTGFLNLEGLYETYSGKTEEESKWLVDAFFAPMKDMPDEVKETFKASMDGGIAGLESKENTLYWKAQQIAGSFVQTFRNVFDIHSPSKVFDKMFRYNIEGGVDGTVDEADKLYKTADDVSETFTKRMKAGISADGLVAKLRAGISEGKALVSRTLTAKVVHDVNMNTEEINRKITLHGDVISHISIDGREFAVISAPYVSEELQWNGGHA